MDRKTGAALLLAGALCLGALGGCAAGAPEYRTVYPDRGAVERLVEDTGTIVYSDNYAILPAAGGKILTCTFEEGQAVAAGETLYVIDAGDLEDQITQARLSLDSAAQSLAQAEAACADLTVRAQASGTVTAVHCHAGDFVSQGSPIADVVDSANLTLSVPFSTQDAAALRPGDPAVLTFPARAGAVSGAVARVYDAPTVLPGGREGVFVEIALQNPGALAEGTQALAAVGDAVCMEAGAVAYATAQTLYATQSGQVLTLPLEAGTAVETGQVVMTLKNDALTNAAQNAALALRSAQVSLELLEAKRGDYTVTAPVDGLMIARTAKQGDYAAAAAPLATLAAPDALYVHVDIDELYINRIFQGQAARVTFTADSGEERTYTAAVRRIDDTGTASGGVTDYTVELTLDDTDGLKAGMNVSVSIVTERKADCLRVPAAAVSGDTVQVLRDGKAEAAAVETGLSGGGYTEITAGLTQDDAVILP